MSDVLLRVLKNGNEYSLDHESKFESLFVK